MTVETDQRQHPKRKSELRDWREFLTPTERVEVEALEKNSQDLGEKRKALSRLIFEHRTRCVSRRADWMERTRKGRAA